MSMQISVDPAALSQEQREAVAGFILAYPAGKACAGTCGGGHAVAEIHAHTAGVVEGPTTAPVVPAVNELEVLQHDHESTLPESAFGKPDEAAAAFGVPPAPLPLGATAAPSIADAAPSTTAHAAALGTISLVPPLVPAPPVPPPANLAPIVAPPTVSHASGVELDAQGLPWDARIHAESKNKIADGTWRKKRQLDPALLAQVEAELRQVMGAAPAVAVPPPPPLVAGAAPTMTAAPSAAPADARAQFVALVGRASAAIQAGKVSQTEVNQCCADAGVPALPLLANRLDLVAQVAAHIDALIAARQ